MKRLIALAFTIALLLTSLPLAPGPAVAAARRRTTVTDDFNRADGGLGANWASIGVNDPQIASNEMDCPTTSVYYGAQWAANDFDADQSIQLSTASHGGFYGIGSFPAGGYLELRVTESPFTAYYVTFTQDVSDIRKYIGGTDSLLQHTLTGIGNSGDHTVKFEVIGTSLKFYVDGSQVGSTVTDSDIASGPKVRFEAFTGNAMKFDNFSADGAIPGGGGGGATINPAVLGPIICCGRTGFLKPWSVPSVR